MVPPRRAPELAGTRKPNSHIARFCCPRTRLPPMSLDRVVGTSGCARENPALLRAAKLTPGGAREGLSGRMSRGQFPLRGALLAPEPDDARHDARLSWSQMWWSCDCCRTCGCGGPGERARSIGIQLGKLSARTRKARWGKGLRVLRKSHVAETAQSATERRRSARIMRCSRGS